MIARDALWAIGIGLVAALSAVAPTEAQAPRDLRSLFPERAEVSVEAGDGLVRLTLPAEVLAACRPDLSDLRLIDSQGGEIPYLVDSSLPPETRLNVTETFRPKLLDAKRSTTERKDLPDILRESYEIEAPDTAPESGTWSLVLSTSASLFVLEATLSALPADGGEEISLAETTFFRLPGPEREKLSVALPPLEHPTLRVTLEGEEELFLEPTFLFEATRALAGGEQAEVELARVATQPPRARRKTRVHLERPRGLVPDVLRIETSTPTLRRLVVVWDEGPGADREPLADATLVRIEAAGKPRDLDLRLRPARGDRLEVVIHDEDSRPLSDLAFHAILRRPALVFSTPAPAGDGTAAMPATLFFGGGRAYLPRYDLTGLVPERLLRVTGEAARITERLFDPDKLGEATLGPSEDNPAFDPAPALAFAMRAGLELNPRVFSHKIEVEAPESVEGLLRMTLSPDVAPVARPDLGDLRLIDDRNRQWSYLLERDAGHVELPIYPQDPERDLGHTVYDLPVPTGSRVEQLILDSAEEFFDRPFEVVGERTNDDRGERVLARGRLVRQLGDPRKIRIDLPGEPLESLGLRIDDGSDPPLDLSRFAARVPISELYFAAPAGRYSLLLGYPEEAPPRYELESVRDVVLAVQAREVGPGRVVENPAFRLSARLSKGSGPQQLLLWGALSLAVLVLAWFTLRLARQE